MAIVGAIIKEEGWQQPENYFNDKELCYGCKAPFPSTRVEQRLCSECNWQYWLRSAERLDPGLVECNKFVSEGLTEAGRPTKPEDVVICWIPEFWPAFAKLYGWDLPMEVAERIHLEVMAEERQLQIEEANKRAQKDKNKRKKRK